MTRLRQRLILLLAVIVYGSILHCTAQEVEAPDYRQIRQTTFNINNPNNYPRLLQQYQQCDTTLTLEQYRYLYYGFALQEDFVPYQSPRTELWRMRRSIASGGGTTDICPEAIRIANDALADNPFDLSAIAILSTAHLLMGDSIEAKVWYDKQTALLDAIASSGDGVTPETAFHVIDVEHEYELCARLGLFAVSDSTCSSQVEYVRVEPNTENIEGLYFNFGACVGAWRRRWEPSADNRR